MEGSHQSTSGFLFFNDTATTEIYTLSLHDALPISTATKSGGSRWYPQAGRMAPSNASRNPESRNPARAFPPALEGTSVGTGTEFTGPIVTPGRLKIRNPVGGRSEIGRTGRGGTLLSVDSKWHAGCLPVCRVL